MATKKKTYKHKVIFRLYSGSRLCKFPVVKRGDKIECYDCGRSHLLKSAVAVQTGKKDDLFLIYYCKREWRFAAIRGRLIMSRKPDMEIS